MATKRTGNGKRKSTKASGKADPDQVSGISAAAIEGASGASGASEASGEMSTENAEKMSRPGPGADVGRRTRRGSPLNDASHAPESGTERESVEAERDPSGPEEF